MKRLVLMTCVVGAVAIMSPAHAVEAFIGRWAMKPDVCNAFSGSTALTTPLVATDTSITWFDGYCRVGKMYKAGHAVYLQMHCSSKGDVPVTLSAYGDRMRVTWGGAKFEEMRRCK
jgi:hypothetical protein